MQRLIDFRGSRLDVNNLQPEFAGKKCVNFGCGNGSISFALLERGAESVYGFDFGASQVDRANEVAKDRGVAEQATFVVGDVFSSGLPDDSFDFAVASAVFHHLETKKAMERALMEVARVLKKGAGLFYYVDGSDAISHDLWDTSVAILEEVDIPLIEHYLKMFNPTREKMTNIADALSATYLHSTPEETEAMLSRVGFGGFKRLISADETSWDPNRIAEDPYGVEKFSTGELRYFCKLENK